MSNDIGEKVFKKRARLRKTGKCIWGIIISIGLLGWIFWKWYALLISFGLAILIGSIYSFITAKKMERETGLDINSQEMVQKIYLEQESLRRYQQGLQGRYQKAEHDYLDERVKADLDNLDERMNEVIGGRKDNEDERDAGGSRPPGRTK